MAGRMGHQGLMGPAVFKNNFFSSPNLNIELGTAPGIRLLFSELSLQITKFPQVSGSHEHMGFAERQS